MSRAQGLEMLDGNLFEAKCETKMNERIGDGTSVLCVTIGGLLAVSFFLRSLFWCLLIAPIL